MTVPAFNNCIVSAKTLLHFSPDLKLVLSLYWKFWSYSIDKQTQGQQAIPTCSGHFFMFCININERIVKGSKLLNYEQKYVLKKKRLAKINTTNISYKKNTIF